jgi:hypothetical protein
VSSYEKVDAVGAGEYARRQSKESSTGREGRESEETPGRISKEGASKTTTAVNADGEEGNVEVRYMRAIG